MQSKVWSLWWEYTHTYSYTCMKCSKSLQYFKCRSTFTSTTYEWYIEQAYHLIHLPYCAILWKFENLAGIYRCTGWLTYHPRCFYETAVTFLFCFFLSPFILACSLSHTSLFCQLLLSVSGHYCLLLTPELLPLPPFLHHIVAERICPRTCIGSWPRIRNLYAYILIYV